jgi:phage recombination protein Bet
MEKKQKEVATNGFSEEKIQFLKRTVCKDATDDELQLFIHVCQKCKLDPFMKQIYAVKRGGQMTIQTSIDGLRLVADRSGNYAPGKEPSFSYDDNGRLISATAYLKKRTPDGTWHEMSSTAFYNEFKPNYENSFWKQMPHVMLSKCAESAALRKGFPAEMSGIYTEEEMSQASQEEETLEFEQCEEILNLVGEDKALLNRILNGYKVKDLSDIKSVNFLPIVGSLKKRSKMGVQA